MKKIKLGNSEIDASVISLGCWRIYQIAEHDAAELVNAALESEINFFDNADVYGGGESEIMFANALKTSGVKREDIFIQTKCGHGDRGYDFSKEHILEAVEGSLKRLRTDYLDVVLLHRPDILMEPEEVAEAFDILHTSGKARYFGVSNHNPSQIELLQRYVNQKFIANQLQFSIMHTIMIDRGVNVNTNFDGAYDRDGGVLDYCRLHDITVQAWSPFQYGVIEGVFLDNDKYPKLNETIDRIAADHGVSNTAVAIAWILRHPAKIQPIVGTTKKTRIPDIAKGAEITLSRREWYDIYLTAGNELP